MVKIKLLAQKHLWVGVDLTVGIYKSYTFTGQGSHPLVSILTSQRIKR